MTGTSSAMNCNPISHGSDPRVNFARCGEDLALLEIFKVIGTNYGKDRILPAEQNFNDHPDGLTALELRASRGIAVEFGAGDGYRNSNTRFFQRFGWSLVQWDCNRPTGSPVCQVRLTAENVNDVFAAHTIAGWFESYSIPEDFDLLSIDVDGNDWHIWRALKYTPRVVIIEYNANFDREQRRILEYHPDNAWQGDVAYGASYAAMLDLGEAKGYWPVKAIGNNLIFVRKNIAGAGLLRKLVDPPLPEKCHRQEGFERMVDPAFYCLPTPGPLGPLPSTDRTVYSYSFQVWPDETKWSTKHGGAALYDLFRMLSSRIERQYNQQAFEQFRKDLAACGITLRDIERVPYHKPESIL